MKIAAMGAGGVGGYFGARLQSGGADVTFIARGAHLDALRQNGIALEGDKPLHLPQVKATDDPSTIGKVDMVLFAVKLRDTNTGDQSELPREVEVRAVRHRRIVSRGWDIPNRCE